MHQLLERPMLYNAALGQKASKTPDRTDRDHPKREAAEAVLLDSGDYRRVSSSSTATIPATTCILC